MIRHVVLFCWAPATNREDVDEIEAALRALPAAIPALRSLHVGADLGIGGNADFAIVADFEDLEGYEVYRDHPAHEAVRETLIMPRVASRTAVQYSVEADRTAQV